MNEGSSDRRAVRVELAEEAGFGSGLRAAIEQRHRLRRDFRI
jgi:hypothetical protein